MQATIGGKIFQDRHNKENKINKAGKPKSCFLA